MKLRSQLLAGTAAAMCAAIAFSQAPPAKGPAPAPVPATPLPWAYPTSAPAPAAPPSTDPTLKHVPNSTKAFTQAQVTDGFNPPDWHPEGHPVMPQILGHGRSPDIRACGYCHLPNGQGRPENSSLAGLPAAYIVAQVADMRNNLRASSEPNMGPPANMLKLAQASNDDEVKIAAEYFSKLKYKPWIKVVESKTAPKTKAVTGMLVPLEPENAKNVEPLGMRIVETPEHLEPTEARDDASPFVAYVPVGSIKRGEALVTTGGSGKTLRCSICHGQDLKGLGNVPFLAGRSPSYLVRQIYDIQKGSRHGGYSPLMKEAVAKLTLEDMVDIAAYVSSRMP
jgi:cytochrome c553